MKVLMWVADWIVWVVVLFCRVLIVIVKVEIWTCASSITCITSLSCNYVQWLLVMRGLPLWNRAKYLQDIPSLSPIILTTLSRSMLSPTSTAYECLFFLLKYTTLLWVSCSWLDLLICSDIKYYKNLSIEWHSLLSLQLFIT